MTGAARGRFARCAAALSLALCAACAWGAAREGEEAPNVVLVTLDGVRAQDIFGGLDAAVLRARTDREGRLEDDALYRRYGAGTPQARREKLMPFLWGTLLRRHGFIAGDAAVGSRVRAGNAIRLSAPGYVELLTGRARDGAVDGNDKRRHPFPTVLEFVRERLRLAPGQVATFGSWDRFELLPEHVAGATYVNAGFMPYDSPDPGVGGGGGGGGGGGAGRGGGGGGRGPGGAAVRALDAVQASARTWPEERFDAFTAAFALDYLRRERPRLLYVALGDADEWAHAGNYAFVLESLRQADDFLRELWTWLQSQPRYRGRTTLIVTTDHGRGATPRDWTDHGPGVEGAQDAWIAVAGAGVGRRGEWRDSPELRLGQVAATIASAFGLDYAQRHPEADPPIDLGR